MKKEIIFQNKMEEVTRIAAFIDEIGEELELDFSLLTSIQLAIEEAVVNVIEYAYPDNVEGQNSLSVQKKGNTIIFVLSDSGTPFDPTAAAAPDLSLPAEDRPIGGLGIMLVKKIMNEVTYQRIDGKNELTMKKNI
ncbi:MAG: ATP-binding protein [Bacteroidaceae bacterium]|nr:ATP-binding protein [Bacteroidaceae bacterium]